MNIEDQWREKLRAKEYKILELQTELSNAMDYIRIQQKEIDDLKYKIDQFCEALGVDSDNIDDIENAINTNQNLEAEIEDLRDGEVPSCVFDAMRWMALKLDLKAGVVGIPTSVARRLYEINTRLGRNEQPFDETTILDGLRWLSDGRG